MLPFDEISCQLPPLIPFGIAPRFMVEFVACIAKALEIS